MLRHYFIQWKNVFCHNGVTFPHSAIFSSIVNFLRIYSLSFVWMETFQLFYALTTDADYFSFLQSFCFPYSEFKAFRCLMGCLLKSLNDISFFIQSLICKILRERTNFVSKVEWTGADDGCINKHNMCRCHSIVYFGLFCYLPLSK